MKNILEKDTFLVYQALKILYITINNWINKINLIHKHILKHVKKSWEDITSQEIPIEINNQHKACRFLSPHSRFWARTINI
jgi:hypothetical protein